MVVLILEFASKHRTYGSNIIDPNTADAAAVNATTLIFQHCFLMLQLLLFLLRDVVLSQIPIELFPKE